MDGNYSDEDLEDYHSMRRGEMTEDEDYTYHEDGSDEGDLEDGEAEREVSAADDDEEEEDDDDYPNPIARLRAHIREPAAEFLGAMVLAIIGTGATAQTNLTGNSAISPSGQGSMAAATNLSGPLAWGIAVAVSVYIAGGISGGHISPVISIVLAMFRGFRESRGEHSQVVDAELPLTCAEPSSHVPAYCIVPQPGPKSESTS